eukprot:229770-Chlamydomonas_euryale.AAC.2
MQFAQEPRPAHLDAVCARAHDEEVLRTQDGRHLDRRRALEHHIGQKVPRLAVDVKVVGNDLAKQQRAQLAEAILGSGRGWEGGGFGETSVGRTCRGPSSS